MIHIHIDEFPPSKKNSKQILRNKKTRKPFIAQSDNAQSFETRWIYRLKGKYPTVEKAIIVCEITSPNRRKYDTSNKFETVADLLVKAKIIPDDNNSVLPASLSLDVGVDANKKGYVDVYLMNIEEFKEYVASITDW